MLFSFSSVISVNNFQNSVFAQSNSETTEPVQNITFKNVIVDTNPVPNKIFKISTLISTTSPSDLIVSLDVPSGISITSPIVANLEYNRNGNDRIASWEIIATQSGTYPVTITARSSNPNETDRFQLNVVVGSLNSLLVTDIDIPGDIFQNDVFTVGITLKNTGKAQDDNVRSQITVPSGLHLLDKFSAPPLTLNSTKDATFKWKIQAEKSGSYIIMFDYSSINSGSNSVQATVNVGSKSVSDIRVSKITLAGVDSMASLVGSGDKNIPLVVNIINVGTEQIYDIDAALILNKPFSSGRVQNETIGSETIPTKTFHVGQLEVEKDVDLKYYVDIQESVEPNVYVNQLVVSFTNGKEQFQKTFDIPISISNSALLSINAQLTKVIQNSVTPITFEIINNGKVSVHNLQISSATGSGFTSLDTPVWIGDLGIGSKKSATMKILATNDTESQLPLPITVKYDANGESRTETYQVAIQSESRANYQIRTVSVNPTTSYPGDVGTRLDIDLLNYGLSDANDVSAKLILPQGFAPAFGNADSMFLGRVESDKSMTATFFINIDNKITPGSYPLTLLLEDSNGTASVNLNFIVAQKAIFEATSIDDSQLYPGAANVPIKITLKNTGAATAESTTTKLVGGNTIPGVKSSGITSVGNIEDLGTVLPGQVFVTTFLVNLDQTHQTGKQTVSLEIKWAQDEKADFIQTLVIPYSVSEGPSYLLYMGGIPVTYVIVAAALAIGGIVFNNKRKNRSKLVESHFLRSSSEDIEKLDVSKTEPIVYNPEPIIYNPEPISNEVENVKKENVNNQEQEKHDSEEKSNSDLKPTINPEEKNMEELDLVQKLIEAKMGDPDRLAFIKKKLEDGDQLYKSDRRYLKEKSRQL